MPELRSRNNDSHDRLRSSRSGTATPFLR